jgi:hypothetical protein
LPVIDPQVYGSVSDFAVGQTMRTFIALAMILTAGVANAQQDNRPTYIMGLGAYNCNDTARFFAVNPSNEGLFFTWAQGFMSGLNIATASAVHINKVRHLAAWNIDDQKSFLRIYCDQHPLQSYEVVPVV